MAGPWEQYASTAETGPWSSYAQPSVTGQEIPGPRTDFLPAMGRRLASMADVTVGGIIPAVAQQVSYPVLRAVGQAPAEAAAKSQALAASVEKPFGKAFGVTQTPEYKTEATQRLLTFIGENINKGTKWLAAKTGLPEADVSNMVGSLTMAAPELNRLRPSLGVNKLVEKVTDIATAAPSTLTGKPAQAYKEAYKAGQTGEPTFIEHLRGKGSPDEILDAMHQGITKMRTDAAQKYATAKTGWSANKTPLDFAPIDKAFADVEASLTQGGKSKIGTAERAKIDELKTVLDEWRADPAARTALDFDALKQRIDAIYPDSPKQAQAQRAITSVRNAVKKEITDNVGEYATAMKNYELQQELLRDISKGLSTGDKVAKETALNKLMSAVKSTPSAELRRDLINAVKDQTGIDLMPAIAGQELKPVIPTSGVGRAVATGGLTAAYFLRHPELAAVLPFTSPRLMGEMYHKLGKLSGMKKETVNYLADLSPTEQAYVNSLILESQKLGEKEQNRNALRR